MKTLPNAVYVKGDLLIDAPYSLKSIIIYTSDIPPNAQDLSKLRNVKYNKKDNYYLIDEPFLINEYFTTLYVCGGLTLTAKEHYPQCTLPITPPLEYYQSKLHRYKNILKENKNSAEYNTLLGLVLMGIYSSFELCLFHIIKENLLLNRKHLILTIRDSKLSKIYFRKKLNKTITTLSDSFKDDKYLKSPNNLISYSKITRLIERLADCISYHNLTNYKKLIYDLWSINLDKAFSNIDIKTITKNIQKYRHDLAHRGGITIEDAPKFINEELLLETAKILVSYCKTVRDAIKSNNDNITQSNV